ncbi:MAG: FkbM family methyltransferase [Victivallaceae bacterium]|nr:FkbM family methyltransferase [Victivallaceae bacterium]
MTPESISRRIKAIIFSHKKRRQAKNYSFLHGVCDNSGGDFKEYFFSEDMPRIIAALKHGLDSKSCKLVDLSIERLKNFPNQASAKGFLVDESLLMTQEERDEQKKWEKLITEYQWDYPLEGAYLLPEAFMYHHGLRDMPETVKDYIRGKDFIDAGAFIGDSALVLHQYGPAKIFSFEISAVNADKYRQNMKGNNIPEENFELIIAGLSNYCGKISFNDIATSGSNLCTDGSDMVEVTTIDEFVKKRNLRVGFIKADIEGSESSLVRGMQETMTKDRPVLSIAIYHNPKDFFEIKPFLESLNLDYKFAIKKFNPRILVPLWETYLIAYPAEIAE